MGYRHREDPATVGYLRWPLLPHYVKAKTPLISFYQACHAEPSNFLFGDGADAKVSKTNPGTEEGLPDQRTGDHSGVLRVQFPQVRENGSMCQLQRKVSSQVCVTSNDANSGSAVIVFNHICVTTSLVRISLHCLSTTLHINSVHCSYLTM